MPRDFSPYGAASKNWPVTREGRLASLLGIIGHLHSSPQSRLEAIDFARARDEISVAKDNCASWAPDFHKRYEAAKLTEHPAAIAAFFFGSRQDARALRNGLLRDILEDMEKCPGQVSESLALRIRGDLSLEQAPAG